MRPFPHARPVNVQTASTLHTSPCAPFAEKDLWLLIGGQIFPFRYFFLFDSENRSMAYRSIVLGMDR